MKKKLSLASAVCLMLSVIFIFAACDENNSSTFNASYQLETCTSCKGSGVCNVCDGEGKNSYSSNAAKTCTICGGNGVCNLCGGNGSVSASTNSQAQEKARQDLNNGNKILNDNNNTYRTGSLCKKCGGRGYLETKCTACNGTGIDSAWEKTKGRAIHSFAEKNCYSCGGTGKKKCFYCSGTGEAN